jgi:hypothetical protein
MRQPCPGGGRRLVALACVSLLFLLPVAARAAAKPYGAESPEALLERAKAAGEKQDFAELAACLAPNDRAMMSMMLILSTGMIVAFGSMGGELASGMTEAFAEGMTAEQKAEAEAQQKKAEAQVAALQGKYEAVLAKHGVKELMEQDTPAPAEGEDPGQAAAKLLADVDQVALIADLVAFMNENMKDAKKEDGEGGEGGPVKIPQGKLEGLKMEGDAAAGTVDGEEVRFVKVDGRWYLAMPEEKKDENKGE